MIGRNGKTAQICEQPMTSMRKIDPLTREVELALCSGCFGKTDVVTPPFFTKSLRQFAPLFRQNKPH